MLDVVNSNVDLLAINLLKDAAGSCSTQQQIVHGKEDSVQES